VFIVALALGTTTKKVDLVAKDYYKQELAFQQQMDAQAATAKLGEPLTIVKNATDATIHFPATFSGKLINGTVYCYAVAGSDGDKTYDFNTAENEFQIPLSQLSQKRYDIKVNWTCDGVQYYQSLPLTR
jgi:hypothetical protein